mmetsp:Transcript_13082/g.26114  ORF Transcript_13082/g.26114 Transcript_13082/m.26114 type:complete len:240 (+) Transcript_13082:147-866(+)|eukprot:CAMPEP_0194322056 /NCGR_PEP_ID=MMETSP0171-20130528/18261_1 /TAXON_ID=218684 /ORGANISM="Corethron pennatum, Strain L29A3" /LENGTH=239 /DNA_ID=CAMNT_0039080217 /DNA_START=80 /DNA_END=799 /DNA_ORIENTATION=+
MQRAPQFITGEFTPHYCFLPDEEYSRALDSIVKACSDVLICSSDSSKVFLGRRKVEPQPDWWYIGGRAKPGERPEDAAARNVRRELGLDLPPSRFEVVGNYSFVWQFREQPPQGNGTADLSTIHRIALDDEEAASAAFDTAEYHETRWWGTDAVLAGEFHPALKRAIRDVRAADAFRKLRAAVGAEGCDGNDAAVATAARAVVEEADARNGAAARLGFGPDDPVAVSFVGGKYVYRKVS